MRLSRYENFNLQNLTFCQVKNASICVLPFKLLLVSLKYFFSMKQFGNYTINSYIDWWKLLTFSWRNTFMKNVSTKANLFILRFSYIKIFKDAMKIWALSKRCRGRMCKTYVKQCWGTMNKTFVKQCYRFAAMYRRKEGILNALFKIPIIFCHWL